MHTESLLLRPPGGAVPAGPAQPGFVEATEQLYNFLAAARPATVLLPWRRDPHPDHRANYHLVQMALAGLLAAPRQLNYVVWAWQRAAPGDLPRLADYVAGFRLAINAVLPQKLRAITTYRSRAAPSVFTDDTAGFLLADDMLAKFDQPFKVFFKTTQWTKTSATT